MEFAHILIRNMEELLDLRREMIDYARKHPFNYNLAIKNAKQDPEFKVEDKGLLVRVSGKKEQEQIAPYNRHITFDGKTPWQATFVYNPVEAGYVAQLSLVECNKNPIDDEMKKLFTLMFMATDLPSHVLNTPPHVYVVAQIISAIPETN